MRLFVFDEPDTVKGNIQYGALGRSFYRCLKEFDLAELNSGVHDDAVEMLEKIYVLLNDEKLDDAACLEKIGFLYQKRLALPVLRKKKIH